MKCIVTIDPNQVQAMNEVQGFIAPCRAIILNGTEQQEMSVQATVGFGSSVTQMGNAIKNQVIAEASRLLGVTLASADVRILTGII